MVEPPKASTLEEMVERKRHLWKHAPIMRQNIKVWAEETPGIIIGPDGPEFAGEGALASSPTEPTAPHEKPAPTILEASTKSIAELAELVTTPAAPPEANAHTPAVTSVASPRADSPATTNTLATAPTLALVQPPDLMATTKAPAAPNPTGLGKPSASNVSSSVDEPPLNVGSRVLWENCPAHCASWNPFTISNIKGGMAWLDIYEKPVPLSALRRAP
jgi:hypothetical protein